MQGQTEPVDEHVEGGGRRLRALLGEMVTTIVDGRSDRTKEIVRLISREPFTRRAWSELSYLTIAAPLAGIGFACVIFTLTAGAILAITFFGLAIMALSVRLARGFGGFHRQLARGLLDEQIEDPEPFVSRPGFLGWLQSSLRDRTGWRSMAYVVVKVPLAILGILVGFAAWWDAFFCLTDPLWGSTGGHVPVFGLPQQLFGSGLFSAGQTGFWHVLGVFCAGIVLFFAAPWFVRGGRVPGPSGHAGAPRSRCPGGARAGLERARAQSVDSSAATLRRIERDLHDGTQAQLVALAMRLGMAKEKLAAIEDERVEGPDLDHVRQLVDDAHRGAKEAIVELRDLARGIHPPALDVGLEGALSTLAARSTIPTELAVRSTTGPRRRSRRSPTSAWPSCSPTWPSTPMPRRPASRARTTGSGCGWWCATTARAERSSHGSGRARAGWSV